MYGNRLFQIPKDLEESIPEKTTAQNIPPKLVRTLQLGDKLCPTVCIIVADYLIFNCTENKRVLSVEFTTVYAIIYNHVLYIIFISHPTYFEYLLLS